MEEKRLGPLLLSGLMIGPILGSGIIILPPLVYDVAGSWALPAWVLMIVISFFFAFIFGQLSLFFPGDAGVANAVESAFGKEVKKLTSFYLIGAVLFGPVAVMLTAAEYINFSDGISTALIAMPILLGSGLLLMMQVSFIGKISFVMSSLAGLILFVGGLITLLFFRKPEGIEMPPFAGDHFGYALLLLFWTIVGWEVVGNYSADVKNPKQTIPRAVAFSAVVIATVSLTVAGAVQMIDSRWTVDGTVNVTAIIGGIFGGYSVYVMGIITFALCVTTYLLFAGGVSRLIASLAQESYLPKFLSLKSETGAPKSAILVLTAIHFVVLVAVYFDLANIEKLVALADGFFIGNAFIGLLAGVKLLRSVVLRIAAVILCCVFVGILLHSNAPVLVVIFTMAFFFGWRAFKEKTAFAVANTPTD